MGESPGRAGRWAFRSGLRPSLQAQRPELNYKDNSFNLFPPLRVYFYECSKTICDTKYDEFHDLIKGNGWERLRQSGSHVIYRKGSRTYPVPYHKGKELGKGLENKMKKDMGLK